MDPDTLIADFFVPGSPVGKKAPQFQRRGAFVHTHPDDRQTNYEAEVRRYANEVRPPEPTRDAIRLELDITLPIPVSASKKRAQEALEGKRFPCVKPDFSNVLKSVEDAIKTVLFVDDNQVTSGSFTKRYGHPIGVRIRVYREGDRL